MIVPATTISTTNTITHNEIIEIAARWLQRRHAFVVAELATNGEQPAERHPESILHRPQGLKGNPPRPPASRKPWPLHGVRRETCPAIMGLRDFVLSRAAGRAVSCGHDHRTDPRARNHRTRRQIPGGHCDRDARRHRGGRIWDRCTVLHLLGGEHVPAGTPGIPRRAGQGPTPRRPRFPRWIACLRAPLIRRMNVLFEFLRSLVRRPESVP
jgi:hypothetical protein